MLSPNYLNTELFKYLDITIMSSDELVNNLYIILRINDTKIKYPIYELDTIESIKIRISANRGTHPLNIGSEIIPSLLPSLIKLQEEYCRMKKACEVRFC